MGMYMDTYCNRAGVFDQIFTGTINYDITTKLSPCNGPLSIYIPNVRDPIKHIICEATSDGLFSWIYYVFLLDCRTVFIRYTFIYLCISAC